MSPRTGSAVARAPRADFVGVGADPAPAPDSLPRVGTTATGSSTAGAVDGITCSTNHSCRAEVIRTGPPEPDRGESRPPSPARAASIVGAWPTHRRTLQVRASPAGAGGPCRRSCLIGLPWGCGPTPHLRDRPGRRRRRAPARRRPRPGADGDRRPPRARPRLTPVGGCRAGDPAGARRRRAAARAAAGTHPARRRPAGLGRRRPERAGRPRRRGDGRCGCRAGATARRHRHARRRPGSASSGRCGAPGCCSTPRGGWPASRSSPTTCSPTAWAGWRCSGPWPTTTSASGAPALPGRSRRPHRSGGSRCRAWGVLARDAWGSRLRGLRGLAARARADGSVRRLGGGVRELGLQRPRLAERCSLLGRTGAQPSAGGRHRRPGRGQGRRPGARRERQRRRGHRRDRRAGRAARPPRGERGRARRVGAGVAARPGRGRVARQLHRCRTGTGAGRARCRDPAGRARRRAGPGARAGPRWVGRRAHPGVPRPRGRRRLPGLRRPPAPRAHVRHQRARAGAAG